MIEELAIAIIALCAIIIVAIRLFSPSIKSRFTRSCRMKRGWPRLEDAVRILVENAPKLKNLGKDEIAQKLGIPIDSELYYHYKQLQDAGRLTINSLMSAISRL